MKNLLIILSFYCACYSSAQNPEAKDKLEGRYLSQKGVLSPISCHGYNIGYMTTDQGEKVVVCFDRLDGAVELNPECSEKMWVEGTYGESTNDGKEGPCPQSTIKLFYVERWGCKDK